MSSILEELSVSILAMSSDEDFWLPNLSPEKRLFGEQSEPAPSRFAQTRKKLHVRSLDGSLSDPTLMMLKHRSVSNLLRPHFSDLASKVEQTSEQRATRERRVDPLSLGAKQSALEKSVLENRRRLCAPKKHLKPTIRLKKVNHGGLNESGTELPRLSRFAGRQNLDFSPRQTLALRKWSSPLFKS